ncbi:VOC family protein [Microbacterium panaciterrae]|uniref:VOC domain-containing protein n=1 Tax=Microbacterium panaciterrae TaxID=985759 RepID=A0ABP8PLP7_9MICO
MTRLHHIGITVSDTERAVDFYTAVGGGTVIGPLVKSGPAVDAATGHPGVEVVLTFVQLDDGILLELAEYRGADAPRNDPDTGHIGAAHPAIVVDDIEAVLGRAASLGYRAQSAVQSATAGPMLSWRYVYLLGPDDVRVELLQMPH